MRWFQSVLADIWEFVARLSSVRPGEGAMRCAAFVRYGGADGVGHVGWAFDFSANEINAGSVENPTGDPTSPPAQMGYWDEFCADPMPIILSKGYDDLKYVNLPKANPTSANLVAKWIGTEAYKVIGRNCLDDAYDVLRAYGVQNLPVPSHTLLPNQWFGIFEATLAHASSFVWQKPRAHPFRERISRLLARLAPAKIPTWRRTGHPDWHDLRRRLAETEHPPNPF